MDITLNPIKLEKMIQADGWYKVKQKGSHRQYRHPYKAGKVTIPFHKGKDLKPETAKTIIKQAGL